MFRTALRNLLAHKARLTMTVLAVVLGVSFVTGTLVFTGTVSESLRASFARGLEHVDVAVQPDTTAEDRPGSADLLGEELLREIAALPEVADATGSISGFAALTGPDGELLGEGWETEGRNYTGADDPRYTLAQGRAPTHGEEVLLDSATAERAGYAVGDTVRMSVDGPVLEAEITGLFDSGDGAVAAGGSLLLFDTGTAQRHFAGSAGGYDLIAISAAEGVDPSAAAAAVEPLLPADAHAITGEQLAADEAAQTDEAMASMRTVLLAFAAVALFVGAFVIANTFTMLIAQRTRELALLRAIGASRRQVTRSVLIEAAAIGTVAGAGGLAAGTALAMALRGTLDGIGMSFPDGPLVVEGGTVATAFGVGVLITMVAAYPPARRAAAVPPVAAMNSVHAPATARGTRVRTALGSLGCALGAALVLLGLRDPDADATPLALGAGGAVAVVGVLLLTPLLSRPVIALAAPLLRSFGPTGVLARRNAVRNPRRTASTASALMIGLTLVTGVTVVAGSAQHGVDQLAADSMAADFSVSMANYQALDPGVRETLAAHPSTTAISGFQTSKARIAGSGQTLIGVDGSAIGELTSLDFDAGSFDGLERGAVVVDHALAERHSIRVGDLVEVEYEDGATDELTVTGVYRGSMMFSGPLVDQQTLAPHVADPGDMQVLVQTVDGDTEAARDTLRAALDDNPAILLHDRDDLSREVASAVTLVLNMLYGLLAMALVVAVLGVVNTLAMSVFERRREIGLLRAVGMDRGGVRAMVRLESLVIALFGGVLGVALGVLLGWAVSEAVAVQLPTMELVLPWGRLALFLGLAAVVGLVAAVGPAWRATRVRLLDAVQDT